MSRFSLSDQGRDRLAAAGTLVFWIWNTIFVTFMLFGFAPFVIPELWRAVREGWVPEQYVVMGVILTAIPLAAAVLAIASPRLRARAFGLGYGVEWPLMLLIAVRFFLLQESNPAVTLILIGGVIGIAAYFWHLLDRPKPASPLPLPLALLQLAGLTLFLLIGLWLALWLTLYAVPITVEFVRIMFSSGPGYLAPVALLASLLWILTMAIFLLVPFAVPPLYIGAWRAALRRVLEHPAAARSGRLAAAAVVALVVVATGAGVILTNRQPQRAAFALLAEPPATRADALALQAQERVIRDGLVNSFLAPRRYLATAGENAAVAELYRSAFGMGEESAEKVQQFHDLIAAPVLYQPALPVQRGTWNWMQRAFIVEPEKAAGLYQTYFGQPLVEAERERVVRSARSTWMADTARANWQAVDDREVWLARQELTVTEQGAWAEIELYEEYHNQTMANQEVVYYFSLPESAVLTGVWLGDSADRALRYPHQVAPRGAAQATYRNEVRRNIDPALLEQIGPAQYRLRVFPILPKRWSWENNGSFFSRSRQEDGPPMHLWLTWQVPVIDGQWALPRFSHTWNVYQDSRTERLVNGMPLVSADSAWLPATLPVRNAALPVARRIDFPGGESVLMRPVTSADLPVPIGNLRLAAILNTSRPMGAIVPVIEAELAELAAWGAVDLYLTATPFHGEPPRRLPLHEWRAGDQLWAGGQSPAELLHQFNTLANGRPYDAIVLLTNQTGFDPGLEGVALTVPGAPLWMVHPGGAFPPGYADEVLTAIQASGGGSVATVREGLQRRRPGETGYGDTMDGYLWEVVTSDRVTDGFVTDSADSPFAPLAARRLILARMAAHRGTIDDLAMLDQLHALALEYDIVTPYSSMIVLVNETQRRLLARLSQQDDRFEREFEELGTTEPLAVTGVPEPEEWLLIGLALLALVWMVRRQRQGAPSPLALP